MPRQKLDTTKHSINLRTGDYDFLKDFCNGKDIDASDIIRAQVSKIVDTIKEQTRTAQVRTKMEIEL